MKEIVPKISLKILLIFLLPLNALFAQTWQTPIQLGGNFFNTSLQSIYFTSSTNGWVVGLAGTILKTSNGGANWVQQPTGTTATLFDVFFISNTQGWAVGASGTILVTSNGGTTWTTQTSGTTQNLNGVFFKSNNEGWAVGNGGIILFTSNGGSSWTAQTSGISTPLSNVYFISGTQGWAVGASGTILVTSNGGTSWSAQTSNTTQGLNSIYFTSTNQGWAVGVTGVILVTNNGGSTWAAQTSGTNQNLNSLHFTSSTNGWISASSGMILRTTNGGSTWTTQTSGTTQALSEIYFTSGTQGWAVGNNGAIIVTSNAGATWTAQNYSNSANLNCVYFISATKGWAVGGTGSGTILTSSDGGINWSAQISGTVQPLQEVFFFDSTNGWAVGSSGVILATTNGGTTWTAQPSASSQTFHSVYFISASQGWIVGTNGSILTTINGGTTWTVQTSGTTESLYSVDFISSTQGWAVGTNGTVLTTSNGGSTWTAQTSSVTSGLNSVSFINASNGWAVGTSGTVIATSNGGSTWSSVTYPTSSQLTSVNFINSTQGWTTGFSGGIYTTSNGGSTWTSQTSGVSLTLQNVFMRSATQGWAVGSSGTILLYNAPPTSSATVTTSTINSINNTSATLGGNVTSSGGATITERGVVYGTTANPTTTNTKVQIGSGIGAFSQNVTGLSAATLYHVRAYAINSVGTSYGGDSTFTTTTGANVAPSVATRNALVITSSSAFLGVIVSNEGSSSVSQRGVVYGTSLNPTFANTKVSLGTGLGNVNTNVTGLTPATLYHVRGFAINSTDTAFGADSTFTTLGSVSSSPTITSFTPTAANVGSTVTITGTNLNNVTQVWFGASPAASFTAVNSTTITAVVPDNAYLGNIAVATTNGFTIGTKYFMVNNPQNVIIGNNDQNSSYYLKNGKLYGSYSVDYDGGNLYRYCPVEMPSKGSLRGKVISQISNSGNHFIALASDNTVHAWGFNSKKQIGDSSNVQRRATSVNISNKGDLLGKTVIQVLAGSYTSYALSSDGQVFSWGLDTLGSLGNGATTNGIVWVPTSISNKGSLVGKTIIKLGKTTAANGYNNVFAIASDGTIHAWGGNAGSSLGTGNSAVTEEPVNINQSGVLAGKTIVEIDGGLNCTLLMDKDGLVYGMGSGLSIGATGVQANPIAIDVLSGSSLYQKRALTMLTGKRGSYVHVLDTSGALHAIGNNVFGNLGTGSTTGANRPVLVEAATSSITGKTIVGIAPGDYCTYLLASDNTMHTFGGANGYGLMNGLTTPNVNKAIAINTLMPPTTDATNISISAITQNSATISCTVGSGVGRLMIIKAFNPIDTVAPANGINFAAAAVQPGGSTIDTSGKVVYLGYGNTVNVSGLVSNRLYHVSIFEYDTFASPCRYNVFKLGTPLSGSFTTGSNQSLPSLTTAKPISISTTSATLGGNISADGGATVTERGVVYATTINPTTANTRVQIGTGVGTFSQNVTGLTASTLYHVRAYAINSVGTSYGADSTFTTLTPSSGISNNTITGTQTLCAGVATDTLKGSIPVGGNPPYQYVWLSSTASATAGFGAASGTNNTQNYLAGALVQTTWFKRVAMDGTNSDTSNVVAINITPTPAKPVISTKPLAPVCMGTSYLNFGANAAPASSVNYTWTAENALVYAQGNTRQFSLVSFPSSGKAKVILTASANGCSSKEEVEYDVTSELTHTATVRYFNKNFVCEANMVNKYQWGFDLQPSLEGAIVGGEINQNYFNATPDFTNRNYWVISATANCYQKTYYNKPLDVRENGLFQNGLMVYPNPVNNQLSIKHSGAIGSMQVQIIDMQGKICQEQYSVQTETNLNMEALVPGVYLVRCVLENDVVVNTKIVKN